MLVLTAVDFERGTVELASAEYATGTLRRSLDDFLNDYSGYAIFVQPSVDKTGVSERALGGQGHWFWSTISSYWRDYAHVALAALLINLLALASPLFTMNVYDRVVPNFAIPTLWALAIGVILTLIFDFILKVARGQIINVAGKQADNELASKVFAHALAIDFEKDPSAQVNSQTTFVNSKPSGNSSRLPRWCRSSTCSSSASLLPCCSCLLVQSRSFP